MLRWWCSFVVLWALALGLNAQPSWCAAMAAGQACPRLVCPLSGPVAAAEAEGLAWMCHPAGYARARLNAHLQSSPNGDALGDRLPALPALAQPPLAAGLGQPSHTPWSGQGPPSRQQAPPLPPPRLRA